MAIHHNHKNKTKEHKHKENPHYGFLVSWQPSEARVKRNLKIEAKEEYAQISVKKDIIKSLILVSLVLTIELVIYLAWNKFLIK